MKSRIMAAGMGCVAALWWQSSALAWSFDIAPGADLDSYLVKYDTDEAAPETIRLDSYTFVFNYSGADLTGGDETPPSPLGLGMNPYNDNGSQVNFTAVSWGDGPLLSADCTLATFFFDGPVLLSWAYTSPDFLVMLNGLEYKASELPLTNSATAPSQTPIPGAAWLLGSALAGLVGFRAARFPKDP